jgi:hypothetical protein
MEILIMLLLALFALGKKKDGVTFQRGGTGAGATGTWFGGSGRGGTDTAGGKPTASQIEVFQGTAGDPSGSAETLDEEGAHSGGSSGKYGGVMIGTVITR